MNVYLLNILKLQNTLSKMSKSIVEHERALYLMNLDPNVFVVQIKKAVLWITKLYL